MANNKNLPKISGAGPGRPKGAPNKNNLVRSWIEQNYKGGIGGYVENILKTIDEVSDPKSKASLLVQLLAYIAPQLKAVDTTLAVDPSSGLITIVYNPTESKDK